MAEINDCFSEGSIVSCKTCFNEELQGEVLSYDPIINTIVLKTKSTSGKSTACDILFVNLHFTSQVQVIKEATTTTSTSLPSLNLSKLGGRIKRSVDEKSKLLQAIRAGGTVEGQKLFLAIGKTIDEISWSGADIVVMNQVMISPPYYSANVTEYKDAKESNPKAVTHIRKIVDKFYKDQQLLTSNSCSSSNVNNSSSRVSPSATSPMATQVSHTKTSSQ